MIMLNALLSLNPDAPIASLQTITIYKNSKDALNDVLNILNSSKDALNATMKFVDTQ